MTKQRKQVNPMNNYKIGSFIAKKRKEQNLKQKDLSKLELSKNGNQTGWVSNKLNGSQLPTRTQWDKLCTLFGIENNYDEILSAVKKVTYNPELTDTLKKLSNKNKGGKLGHLSSSQKRDTYIQNKTGYPKSILKFNREVGVHPTQKPVALLEYLIKTYTSKGDTVLDNCMGSGSTGVACIKTNRNFIGIELDKQYFNVARQRINDTLT